MNIAITGASGFIGGGVLAHFGTTGDSCITLGRRAPTGSSAEHRPFALGPEPDAGTFDGVDTLIHCAWDLSVVSARDIYQRNVVGSINLLRAAQTSGVSRIVFISSMSAYRGTRQLYGRSKLDVEALVAELGGVSLRLGLVWGGDDAGGMAGAVQKLTALPVVPVLNRKSYQFTVDRNDVNRAIEVAVRDRSLTGTIGVAQPTRVAIARLLTGLARQGGVTRMGRLVPLPWQPVYWAMRAVEAARIPLPLRSDSVLGLVKPAPEVPNADAWPARGLELTAFPG